MRIRTPVSLAVVLLAACASTPREPVTPAPAQPPTPVASVEPPVASASSSASVAPPVASSSAAVSAPPAEPEGPRACPAGMKLVDGEYCTEVEHTCLREWYDKSNKKTICEEFSPKARCVGKKVKKRFCIDDYPWPNEKGVRAEVMNNFYQAQVKCAAVDKRICTESEWTLACEGPEMKPFPYGWVRDPTKCNGDQKWDGPDMKKVAKRDPRELARLWKGVPNGAQPECKSDFGVEDLPGNTDDVVSNESWEHGGMYAKYESVHTGGPWYKGTRNQCRPKIYTHDEGFYYYFLSFRCCAEADEKPTDPRTPHQRKESEPFSKVESIARFSVADVKAKLDEKRRTGGCACKEKDTLCKTMCGTLLGPDATDIDLKAPRERETPPPKKKRR